MGQGLGYYRWFSHSNHRQMTFFIIMAHYLFTTDHRCKHFFCPLYIKSIITFAKRSDHHLGILSPGSVHHPGCGDPSVQLPVNQALSTLQIRADYQAVNVPVEGGDVWVQSLRDRMGCGAYLERRHLTIVRTRFR